MRKNFCMMLVFLGCLFMVSLSFAEPPGIKADLGYQLTGGQDNLTKDISGHTSGIYNGIDLNVRWQDTLKGYPIFVRTMFNYSWLSGGDIKGHGGKFNATGHSWELEGDLGWQVYRTQLANKDFFDVTPYIGFGYRAKNIKANISAGNTGIDSSSPYAAIGNILGYETGKWSFGFDTALLLPLAGKFETHNATWNTGVGVGARLQVPVHYRIAQIGANNGTDVSLFLTPFVEYVNYGTGEAMGVRVRHDDTRYGFKTGIGFSF